MSKRTIIFAAAFAASTAMTTLGANAGWGHSGYQNHSSGLLGLNVNVGGRHNDLANVRANVGGVVNAGVNVGGNSHRGWGHSRRSSNGLLNLNVNVGGSNHHGYHHRSGVGW